MNRLCIGCTEKNESGASRKHFDPLAIFLPVHGLEMLSLGPCFNSTLLLLVRIPSFDRNFSLLRAVHISSPGLWHVQWEINGFTSTRKRTLRS